MKLALQCLSLVAAFSLTPLAAQQPSSAPSKEAGKQVFDKTCKECHGALGEGNPLSDKFYKIVIPRLNSEAVQKLSDDEIKFVIKNGRRKMRPPLVGQPQMTHKVNENTIDSVILYVRSLKKG
jgi:mono/diheme cytochrome c family protein